MSDEEVLWLKSQFLHRNGFARATPHQPSDDRAGTGKPESGTHRTDGRAMKILMSKTHQQVQKKGHSRHYKSVGAEHMGKRI